MTVYALNFLATSPPSCAAEAGTWCQQVWDATHVGWLAASASWLVAKPVKILFILLIALVARYLAHRLINRLTNGEPAKLRMLRHVPNLAPMSVRRAQRTRTIGSVLKSIVSAVVWAVAILDILAELGVNLTPIIASAGVVGVAVGFGAQNLVRDFISGMLMLLEDQYGVGDIIDIGPAAGVVEAVGLRVTTLRDANGTVWYVRNGEVLRVGNLTQGHAVAVIDIPLGFGADPAELVTLAERTLAEATPALGDDVLEPPEVLGIEKVTVDGIVLRSTVKVRPGKQMAVQRELRAVLLKAFNDAGVEGPAPRVVPIENPEH